MAEQSSGNGSAAGSAAAPHPHSPSEMWADGDAAAPVVVPEAMRDVFADAHRVVHEFFRHVETDAGQGMIRIAGERYLLVRARTLSVDFLRSILDLYADRGSDEAMRIGHNILFDVAHVVGAADARNFHEKMGLSDPIERLSAGPIHFAYTGWAVVDILPESSPTPDDDFVLAYRHPYSFEADSWIQTGEVQRSPVCIMNAGYSSGWCEESFGVPLTAVELTCRACGDDDCSFVMAPPHRMPAHLLRLRPATARRQAQDAIRIPSLFERKRIEDALVRAKQAAEESETRFRLAFEHAPIGIAIVDAADGCWHQVNEALSDILGLPPASLVGRPVEDYVEPADRVLLRRVTAELLAGADRTLGAELRYVRADGATVWGSVSMSVMAGSDGARSVIHQIEDVTAKRQMEVQVRHGQKLEAVGRLAAGIAHEVNTPVQYVSDNVTFLREAFEALLVAADAEAAKQDDLDLEFLRQEVPTALTETLDGIAQVARIVQAMKSFAHPSVDEFAGADIDAALADAATLARNEVKYVADVEWDLAGLPLVECRIGDMQQVFLNLIVNAAHAIADRHAASGGERRGTITIRTRIDGDSAVVEVEDDGGGIPEHVQPHVFDPFFTTKEVGRGTGQGLALAHAVIGAHHGTLTFETTPGEGTVFRARLPFRQPPPG